MPRPVRPDPGKGVQMMVEPLHPLRFEPILKELIWGGRRLATVLNKPLGAGAHYAESWEISDHRDDVSRVAEGPLAGTLAPRPGPRPGRASCSARAVGRRDQFPLLVKFLDAHQVLSVQVHPDDERGRRLADDNGKTEAWVVIHAEPGSLIYAGLRPGVTRERFRRGAADRRGRAAAAPVRGPGRRLHPDPGRDRPRDRRGGRAGGDPADVRRDLPGPRLGPRRGRRQAPAAPPGRGAGVDRLLGRPGRSR